MLELNKYYKNYRTLVATCIATKCHSLNEANTVIHLPAESQTLVESSILETRPLGAVLSLLLLHLPAVLFNRLFQINSIETGI